MRRALTIAAIAVLLLAAGEPAATQSSYQGNSRLPSARAQTKQPAQSPGRSPNLTLISPSQALIIAERLVPNSKALNVKLLPGGNYAVTLRLNNQLQRVIIDGDTGSPR